MINVSVLQKYVEIQYQSAYNKQTEVGCYRISYICTTEDTYDITSYQLSLSLSLSLSLYSIVPILTV